MNPHDSHMYFTEGKASDGRLVVVRGVCHGTEKTAFEGVTFGGLPGLGVGFWGSMASGSRSNRPSRDGALPVRGFLGAGRPVSPKAQSRGVEWAGLNELGWPDRAIAGLVGRQRGLVTRRQLLAVGV